MKAARTQVLGLSTAEEKYLSELAAEIVASGGLSADIMEDIGRAHSKRAFFAQEMLAGSSARSKMVRRVMAAETFSAGQRVRNLNVALTECAGIARSDWLVEGPDVKKSLTTGVATGSAA